MPIITLEPDSLSRSYDGAFDINKESISYFISNCETLFESSESQIEIKYSDSSRVIVKDINDIDSVPLGNRKDVQEINIITENDTDSCSLNFDLRFGGVRLYVRAKSSARHKIQNLEKGLKGFRPWYSFLFHKIMFWLLLGTFFFLTQLPGVLAYLNADMVSSSAFGRSYMSVAGLFLVLVLSRLLLFDKYILNFSVGKKRERILFWLRNLVFSLIVLKTLLPEITELIRSFF